MGWDAVFLLDEQGLPIRLDRISRNDANIIGDLVNKQHPQINLAIISRESGTTKCIIVRKLGFMREQKIEVELTWHTGGVDRFGRLGRIVEYFVKYF